MRDIFSWIVTFLALSVLLTVSGLNLHLVKIDLSPAHAPIDLPLFAVILGAAAIGFIWGTLITWLAAGPLRAEERRLRRTVQKLEGQITQQESAAALRAPEVITTGLLSSVPTPESGQIPPRGRRWWPW